ncbi:hypothetical protein LUZ62_020855 [Rhynchospora pubera]|uniref:Gustatory receptor n=1 Tax=Rhynchospora pubera TaxID=906938 RepID=A0AAV8GTF6_9POAL|nr:hypothetical protein LUZ62_020855 [Rhynchospora pubera]
MAINRRTCNNGFRFLRSVVRDREPLLPLLRPSSRSDLGLKMLRLMEEDAHYPFRSLNLMLIAPVAVVLFQYWNNFLSKVDFAVEMELAVAAFVSFYSSWEYLENRWLTDIQSSSDVSQRSAALKSKLLARLEKKKNWLYSIITTCFFFTGIMRLYWFVMAPSAVLGIIGWIFWAVLSLLDVVSITYRVVIVVSTALVFQSRCIVQLLLMEEFSKDFLVRSEVHRDFFADLREIENRLDRIGLEHQLYVAAFVITTTICELINSLLLVTRNFDFKSLELIVCTLYLAITVLMFLVHAVKIADHAKVLTHQADQWITCLGVEDLEIGDALVYSEDGTNQRLNMDLTNSIFYEMYLSKRRNALGTYMKKYIVGIYIYGYHLDKQLLRALVMTQISLGAWILKKTIEF